MCRCGVDDAAIVSLVVALRPDHPVERIGDLLARSVRKGPLARAEAAALCNDVLKGTLKLWTSLVLVCREGQIAAR